jgi:hypothetical protein
VSNAKKGHQPQWFQYPDNESTWEIEVHVADSKALVKPFWADLNIKKSEFDGHEVHASPENIGELFNILNFIALQN